MAPAANLEAALKRLASALDQLEAASGRLARLGTEKAELEEVLAVMQDDRTRLALDLDAALARGRALQQVTRDVGQRLSRAKDTLSALLEAAGQD